MSFLQKIIGYTSGNGAEIDADNQLLVKPSLTDSQTGKIRFMSENNSESGGTLYLKSPETSSDYRLRIGQDSVLFEDNFNATSQNTATWRHVFSTMTMTQSGGFLNVNAGSATASGNSASLQTHQYFPLIGTAPLYGEFVGSPVNTFLANQVFEAGFFIPNASSAPADGVFFRITSAGVFGVLTYNGVETVTAIASVTMTSGQNFEFTIVVDEREVEFWIDDENFTEIAIPSGNAQPMLSGSIPFSVSMRNTGTVSGSPVAQVKVGNVSVTLADVQVPVNGPTWAALNGWSHQGLNGGTMGQLVQFSNTAEPTGAAATNTTAALGTGLGGLFKANAMASSATDLIISSYQNPAGGVNQTARNLIITGVRADVTNQVVAVATTAFNFQCAIAFGHTAVSLATTETASFATATTKAPRRVPVGSLYLPVAAAVGQNSNQIRVSFQSPLIVYPGQFVAFIIKPVLGTATATETLLFNIGFDHYFM
jgi:hypothetical protein